MLFLHVPDRTGGGAGQDGRGNPGGFPQGVDGEPEGLTGGRHVPAPWCGIAREGAGLSGRGEDSSRAV